MAQKLDITTQKAVNYEYDSLGRLIHKAGLTTTSITPIYANPLRYRGYYYDTESGLYYLGSRYYDPAVKRFINADSANLIIANPYGLTDKNLFAYCDNNPICRKDAGGEIWNIVIGAVVGGIGGAISALASGGNVALGAAQAAIANR